MNNEKKLKLAEYLNLLVNYSSELIENSSGLKQNILSLQRRCRRVTSMLREKDDIKIGVFGAPSRGKSTLLNALLGVKILPTKVTPGHTKCCIEMKHNNICGCKLNILDESGGGSFADIFDNTEEIKKHIEDHFDEDTSKMMIEMDFDKSEILKKNKAILVDTPGAEVLFEDENEGLNKDTSKALQMLDECHCVIFCTRADYLEGVSDFEFYKRHIRYRNPINIINFKDRIKDQTEKELERMGKKVYKFEPNMTAVVSAKIAVNNLGKKDDSLSGIKELIEKVVKNLDKLRQGQEIFNLFAEYQEILKVYENLSIKPPKIECENFFYYAKNLNNSLSKMIINNKDNKIWE